MATGLRARYREHQNPQGWFLGIEEIDRFLPTDGLQQAGLHEIKPEQPGDVTGALGFALGLGARRLRERPGGVVWVQPVRDVREHGGPYGPGLASFGLDPARLIVVAPNTLTEALWAIEESLKGTEEQRQQSLALVLACISASTSPAGSGSRTSTLSPTAQRRLSLAAAQGGAPCLLLTSHAQPGLGSAHTRWRVGRQPDQRLRVRLERCRGAGATMGSEGRRFDLEWCDEAYRFRLSASVADRAPEASHLGSFLPKHKIGQARAGWTQFSEVGVSEVGASEVGASEVGARERDAFAGGAGRTGTDRTR